MSVLWVYGPVPVVAIHERFAGRVVGAVPRGGGDEIPVAVRVNARDLRGVQLAGQPAPAGRGRCAVPSPLAVAGPMNVLTPLCPSVSAYVVGPGPPPPPPPGSLAGGALLPVHVAHTPVVVR